MARRHLHGGHTARHGPTDERQLRKEAGIQADVVSRDACGPPVGARQWPTATQAAHCIRQALSREQDEAGCYSMLSVAAWKRTRPTQQLRCSISVVMSPLRGDRRATPDSATMTSGCSKGSLAWHSSIVPSAESRFPRWRQPVPGADSPSPNSLLNCPPPPCRSRRANRPGRLGGRPRVAPPAADPRSVRLSPRGKLQILELVGS